MSKLMSLLAGHSKESGEVYNTLSRLDREKVPVRLEIEGANIHFYTRVSVKSATVIVAKPVGLREGLNKGSMVRFKVPGEEGRELRLEVITPHFNLSNGSSVFLCKVPSGFVENALRGADRYNTSRFSNIYLELPGQADTYRVIDLSLSGCKVFLHDMELQSKFKLGEPIKGTHIQLGDKVRVELEALVPRNHRGQTVGCEIMPSKDGSAPKYLEHLIQSLQKAEEEKLHN